MDKNEDMNLIYVKSFLNRKHINNSKTCGCFYCLAMFESSRIEKWVDNRNTALCPECGIDAVLPEKYANKEMLEKMQDAHYISIFTKKD